MLALPALILLGCASPQSCVERLRLDQGECRKLMEATDRQQCVEAVIARSAQCERPPAPGR
jgi:hypothetical protein